MGYLPPVEPNLTKDTLLNSSFPVSELRVEKNDLFGEEGGVIF
jgi:hypothetical protein